VEEGAGAPVGNFFGDDEVVGRGGGDLREMGDTKDLPATGEIPHAGGDLDGDFPSHVRVDLIEDEERHIILLRKDTFEGQHHTGNFAA